MSSLRIILRFACCIPAKRLRRLDDDDDDTMDDPPRADSDDRAARRALLVAARMMRVSSRARSPPIVAVASPAFVAGAPRQRRRRRDDIGDEEGGGGGKNDDDDRGRCRVVTGDRATEQNADPTATPQPPPPPPGWQHSPRPRAPTLPRAPATILGRIITTFKRLLLYVVRGETDVRPNLPMAGPDGSVVPFVARALRQKDFEARHPG